MTARDRRPSSSDAPLEAGAPGSEPSEFPTPESRAGRDRIDKAGADPGGRAPCSKCKTVERLPYHHYCRACYNDYYRGRYDRREYYRKRYQEEGYRETNKLRLREWRKTHRAENTANCRRWRERHPEKAKAHDSLMAARRRGAKTEERFSPTDIYERDGFRCHLCGGKVPQDQLTLDHLIPIADGGPHTPANVATAHKNCNSRRGRRGAAQLRLLG